MIKRTVIILTLIMLLSACINLRSPFESVSYYYLSQQPLDSTLTDKLNAALLVRGISVSNEFYSEKLLAFEEGQLKRYHYHRWVADFQEMISDYFINRFNFYQVFSGGAVTYTSAVTPEYILEGHISEMLAFNYEDSNEGRNSIRISARFMLLKRIPQKAEPEVIFNKLYNERVQRINIEAATIAPAYSIAFSNIADDVLKDIINAIGSNSQSIIRRNDE